VDPVRALVAPRVLALATMMALLDVVALVFGVLGGYLAAVGVLSGTTGGFLESFAANATTLDLVASVLKVALFGVLIGVICCWYGLTASGGAAGVGRAVNRAIVASLVAIFLVNLLYTQWFLAEYPEVSVFR
jgi:phospholipid/cholesterol/gamma-HCH transport system permease protein